MSTVETLPEPRLVNIEIIDRLWISHDATRCEVSRRGAVGDLAAALRMMSARGAKDSILGLLITDVRTGERWYTRRDVIERHQLAQSIAMRHRLDEWHLQQGHAICWCDRWMDPDEMIEGTCGASECLRNEAADRAGLVP